ncbi:MAG: hypothetical protein R2856_03980 [Caldilineaceae bacterium]
MTLHHALDLLPNDVATIEVTTDGGQNWVSVYQQTGTALAVRAAQDDEWTGIPLQTTVVDLSTGIRSMPQLRSCACVLWWMIAAVDGAQLWARLLWGKTLWRLNPVTDTEKRPQALAEFSPVAEATSPCQQGVSTP